MYTNIQCLIELHIKQYLNWISVTCDSCAGWLLPGKLAAYVEEVVIS